ncbi:MAG: adenosylcobinamide-GDP ribazoletransferase [PVC group bacterium]|nr:adenosylcobinamide-GDP ribazoletransferase [PVC group bacterium]
MFKHFLLAVQFLTIIPIKIKGKVTDRDIGKSLLFFSVVGLLIGWVLVCVLGLFSFLPSLVLGAILLITNIVITGALHLDGVADTCDGLYGMQPKEKALEIMRDSRVGAMGVVGLICLLLLKFSLFFVIADSILWKALFCMGIFSRWAQAFVCFKSAYPRKEGKAKIFIENAGRNDVLVGGYLTAFIFLLLSGIKGIVVLLLALGCVVGFKYYVKKRIGGMTGDTIGAVSELAEVAVLFFSITLNSV